MSKITDENVYLNRMRNAFKDKAWFMEHFMETVDNYDRHIETAIDFGSADNSFINYLKNDVHQMEDHAYIKGYTYPNYPNGYPTPGTPKPKEWRFIGIENNESFYQKSVAQGQECYHSLTEMCEKTKFDRDKTVLILNSVLHEVYSYGYADTFWNEILVTKPRFIAIRDMYAKDCGNFFSSGTMKEFEGVIASNPTMQSHYEDFKKRWGRAYDGYTALHFMYKYFYDENWDRECDENYIPFSYRDLVAKIRSLGYNINDEKFYGLPYLKKKWSKDFNAKNAVHMDLFIGAAKTHMKLLLERADEK